MTYGLGRLSRTFLAGAVTLLGVACSSTTIVPPPAGDGAQSPVAPAPTPAPGPDETSEPAPTGTATPTNPAWGANKCPALPAGITSGVAVGQQLKKLVVKDCDGNDYPLENVCGAPATWIFVAHGWCPHCQAATASSEEVLASYAGKNVAAVNVLVQNAQNKAPTAADCKAWKKAYGLANVIALYDPKGVTEALYDEGYTALNVFIDEDRVIRSKFHGESETTINAGIDAALAPR